jgi:hypothetical protein
VLKKVLKIKIVEKKPQILKIAEKIDKYTDIFYEEIRLRSLLKKIGYFG